MKSRASPRRKIESAWFSCWLMVTHSSRIRPGSLSPGKAATACATASAVATRTFASSRDSEVASRMSYIAMRSLAASM